VRKRRRASGRSSGRGGASGLTEAGLASAAGGQSGSAEGGRTGGAARASGDIGAPGAPVAHRITLLSRPGCHLCDDARAVVARVAADLGQTWEERDITRSAADMDAYSDMIPVTLIDGVQHDFWRVSEERLRAALAGGQR
jgi:hypothetical protein